MSNTGSPYSSDPWRRDDDNPLQPTGWERPSSDPSSNPSSASSASSQSSAAEWPSYPPGGPPNTPPGSQSSAPEPTRSFSADQQPPANPGFQPYEQQSMPGYGTRSSPGGYGSNPYAQNPYDQQQVNPYQQNPYQGYSGYQAYAPPPQHPQATTAFILGLLGLVICPPVGIAGLVMGGRVRREIDASGGQQGGRGLATAGWVLGIISVVYFAVIVAYLIFIFVLIGTGAMNS